MLRNIKSFVRRERRMTKAQKEAMEKLWSQYGLEQTDKDPAATFSNHAPIILEIGFGMGSSLVAMAKHSPDYNFIGIEVYRPGIGAALIELEKQQLTNVKIFSADAVEILTNNIPDKSLTKVLLFFPDPWPKRKHHKRRIVNESFLNLLAQKIKPGGIFHMATDCDDYMQHAYRLIANHKDFIISNEDTATRPLLTKFEQRGQRLGHKIHDLIATRNYAMN